MRPLPRTFYTRPDVVQIARELLGKYLFARIDGRLCGGIIVETEAYSGRNDRACHASGGRRTRRTEVMYRRGGIAYVYFTYGMHHLFNIVTNEQDRADAVLIRALEPCDGIPWMLERRGLSTPGPRLTAGPAMLTQALGITLAHNAEPLTGGTVWVADAGQGLRAEDIEAGPRVGVAYAGEHALLPWRFSIRGNRWVSKAKPRYDEPPPCR